MAIAGMASHNPTSVVTKAVEIPAASSEGFGATVPAETTGTLEITAHDPDTGN